MSLLFSWSWMYVLWLTLGCIPWHSDITRAGQFLFIEIPNHIVWIMTNMTTIWTLSWRSCSNFYPLFADLKAKEFEEGISSFLHELSSFLVVVPGWHMMFTGFWKIFCWWAFITLMVVMWSQVCQLIDDFYVGRPPRAWCLLHPEGTS